VRSLLALLLVACTKTHPAPTPPVTKPPAAAPVTVGTKLFYKGTITWLADGAELDKSVTYEVTVTDMFTSGEVTAYALHGWVTDLMWSDGAPKTEDHVLVVVRDREVRVSKDQTIVAQLRSAKDPKEVAATADLIYRMPLRDGQKVCESEDEPCATVERRDAGRFEVTRRTSPDTIVYLVEPGAPVGGIIEFHYHHHGTPGNADVELDRITSPSP
jgi:hypothetical protein